MSSLRKKWETIWMAVAFAEAGEADYARAISQESRRQLEDRAEQQPRLERRPRPRIYRS